MKRGIVLVGLLSFSASCAQPFIASPSTIPAALAPVAIAAPFDRTWDATVSWFTEQSVPIKTIDKSSGLIVAMSDGTGLKNKPMEKAWLEPKGYLTYADCGARNGRLYDPTAATYSVHVTKAGEVSRLQVTIRYEQDGAGVGNRFAVCSSTGKREAEIFAVVKQRAEAGK